MARGKRACHWRAFVTIDGVPSITESEMEKLAAMIPGSIRHEVHHRKGGKLHLDWRFTTLTAHVDSAISWASKEWRAAVGLIDSAGWPECQSFRVMRINP